MIIKPKSEKGAITLVVLVGMLFLTTFLMSMYITTGNKARISAETTNKIAEKYNNIGEAEEIYNNYFAQTDIIPIYTREQLAKIGSGESISIKGKIYTFSKDANYLIQNDLDLGGYYDETTGRWTAEKQWTPLPETFTGILDGLGHTIKGIYLGENEGTQGIFEELNGTIKNIRVKNSYKINNMNGLLAGVNNGDIINCYYEKVLIGLKAGDYVNYEPTAGTYKVADESTGYTTKDGHQSFTTDIGLKWRILSIDEETGKIELVASTQTANKLTITGANGYNHAVDILNDMCKELYSNTNGATARSINLEDINDKTTYDYTTYNNGTFAYGDTKRLSDYGIGYMNYPKLYSQEKGYGTAGTMNTTGLEVSKGLNDGVTDGNGITKYSTVTGSINGNTAGTDPYVTNTYYYYNAENYLDTNLGINNAPTGLLKTGTDYWLATRCVCLYSYDAGFVVRCMRYDGSASYYDLFNSSCYPSNPSYAVRPIVSLDPNVSYTKDTINSTETTAYWNIEF